MKVKETRLMIITYCDLCGKELTNTNHSSIEYPDGKVMDFCSTYSKEITVTCLDKYKKMEHKK